MLKSPFRGCSIKYMYVCMYVQRETKVTWQREICSIKKQRITFWAALYPELPSYLFCWEKIYFLCSLYLCLTFFVNSSFWLILILCCNSFCVRYKKNKETENNSRGLPSRAPYLHVYRKETQELIFSWLSRLAPLLVGVYARWRQSHTRWWPYSKKQVERDIHPWFIPYFFDSSMLWSIDTCQYKVSADQYHVTIPWAQV